MKKRIFIFLSVLFFTSFFAGNWASAATFIDPVEVTPATVDAWTDVDVSPYVPAGTTGVILHAVVTTHVWWDFGYRKNGSTDDRHGCIDDTDTANHWVAVGVDANRILELYIDDTTNGDVYLVGYYTDDAVFFTNAVDKSLSALDTWTDIDISSDTGADTAIGAIFEVKAFGVYYYFGLRNNGSTDNRTHYNRGHDCPGFVVGVDGNEICEGYITNTAMDFFLLGYIVSDHTFLVNGTDLSLGTTGSWLDLSALPTGASGAYIEVRVAYGPYYYGLRKNGSSEDIYQTSGARVAYGIVEADADRIIEGKIESGWVDFFLLGYPTAVPVRIKGNTVIKGNVTIN